MWHVIGLREVVVFQIDWGYERVSMAMQKKETHAKIQTDKRCNVDNDK